MGDTQIQYSSLLEGHWRRHAYKQLGFRVVLLPEARKVTSHLSALGKCISTGNAMGSETIGNEGICLMWDGAWLKSAVSELPLQIEKKNFSPAVCLNVLKEHDCNNCWSFDQSNKSQLYTLGSVEKLFSKCWKLFLVHLLPPGSLASNQRCHYPCWGLIRDTRLYSWQEKKKHAQHFLKLLMFYPIIHKPGSMSMWESLGWTWWNQHH